MTKTYVLRYTQPQWFTPVREMGEMKGWDGSVDGICT
jgi:hypothetical protein